MELVMIKSCRLKVNGRRGVTLTLPRLWVTKHGIKSGDEVEIYEGPNSSDLYLKRKKKK